MILHLIQGWPLSKWVVDIDNTTGYHNSDPSDGRLVTCSNEVTLWSYCRPIMQRSKKWLLRFLTFCWDFYCYKNENNLVRCFKNAFDNINYPHMRMPGDICFVFEYLFSFISCSQFVGRWSTFLYFRWTKHFQQHLYNFGNFGLDKLSLS